MKNYTYILCLIFFLQNIRADTSAQIAKTIPLSAVAQILRPNDPIGIALGLTGAAYREGLLSTYTNPAGMRLYDIHVAYSHIPVLASEFDAMPFNQEAAGAGVPLGPVTLGAQFYNLNLGKWEFCDPHGNPVGKKRTGLREFQITGAGRFTLDQNELSFGLTLKYLQFYMSICDDSEVFGDAGIRYRINRMKIWYSIGISAENFGHRIELDEQLLLRPMELFRIGAAIGTNDTPDSDLGMTGTVEFQKSYNDADYIAPWSHLGTGLEVCFLNHLFARLGYHFDLSEGDENRRIQGMTYGIGFKTPRKIRMIIPVGLSLNYGKGIYDYRKLNANVISIDLGF
ncbi:hypothetical protein JW835_11460 [bacterium]|nr:hypothetical protein [bacterium]